MPTVWPEEVITIAALPEVDLLPAPAAANFRYSRDDPQRAPRRTRPARPNREITHSINADITGSIAASGGGNRQPKDKSSKTGKSANRPKCGQAAQRQPARCQRPDRPPDPDQSAASEPGAAPRR